MNGFIFGFIFLLCPFSHSAKGESVKAKTNVATFSVKGESVKAKTNVATFSGGCFWCMESDFETLKGVVKVFSGFSGGEKINPSYKDVSRGLTKHIETIQVHYDPKKISYTQLLYVFWRSIDPTDAEGQFVDRGHQYTTAIFYHNESQKEKALKSKKEISKLAVFKEKKIITPLLSFKTFYLAEDYHQDYYKRNPVRYKYYRYRSGRNQFLKKTWGEIDFHMKLFGKK